MLRHAFSDRLKQAMKEKDARAVSTIRLILAALKERDIAARGQGRAGELDEAEIGRMLQGLVKQRRDSIALYERGGRPELARQEQEEIVIIESFLPPQMDEPAIEAAARAAIADTGAGSIRDMGKVMAALRERHGGAADPARAAGIVKRLLG